LIGRLNDALGEVRVRRLFFQLARIPPSEVSPPTEPRGVPPAVVPLDPAQELALEREVASVSDPQLREILKDFRRRLLQARPAS